MSAVDKLIKEWAKVPEGELLPADAAYINRAEEELSRKGKQLWAKCETEKTGCFHKRLGGVPYIGNLRNARVFLLMVNPTVRREDHTDYENNLAIFRKNRLQELNGCFALQENGPRAWACYYRNEVFGALIQALSDVEYTFLESSVAILELIPYYSCNAELIRNLKAWEHLHSAKIVRAAVRELAADQRNLIVPRWKCGPEYWGLAPSANVVPSPARRGLSITAQAAIRGRLEQIAAGRSQECSEAAGTN